MQHYRVDPALVDRTGRLRRQHPRPVLQLRQLHGGLRPLEGRHGLSAEDHPLPAGRPVRPPAGIAGAVALLLLRHLLGHLPAQRGTGRADDGDPPVAGQPLRLDRPLAPALPVGGLGVRPARRRSPLLVLALFLVPGWLGLPFGFAAIDAAATAHVRLDLFAPNPVVHAGDLRRWPRCSRCCSASTPLRMAGFVARGRGGLKIPLVDLARQGVRVRRPRRHAEALAAVRQRRARPVAPPLPARHRLRDDAAAGRRVPPGVPARRCAVPLDRAVRLLRDRGAARRHRARDAEPAAEEGAVPPLLARQRLDVPGAAVPDVALGDRAARARACSTCRGRPTCSTSCT